MHNPSLNQLPERLILASASPQRIKLLAQAGIKVDLIIAPHINETPKHRELPKNYNLRMASEKAITIHQQLMEQREKQELSSALILAFDTIVCLGRRILPKANCEQQVKECLELLSGRRHRVYSSVCLLNREGKIKTRTVLSLVKFKILTPKEIEFYIKSGEGIGKAGGYAIQGIAARFINFISGSYSAIVGLPIYETAILLQSSGFNISNPELTST